MLSAGLLQWTHTHTLHNTRTGVCAQQGAQILFHKICCCHGIALHLLTSPWKRKNDDWHGALSEVGQERPSQVKLNQMCVYHVKSQCPVQDS